MKIARIAISIILGLVFFFGSSAVSQMSDVAATSEYSIVQNQIAKFQLEKEQEEHLSRTASVKSADIYKDAGFAAKGAVNLEAGSVNGIDIPYYVTFSELEDGTHNEIERVVHQIPRSRDYSLAQKKLIARVVYAESRGEIFEGQVAVASVVLNRYESGLFGSSIRYIVFAPNQFAITEKYNDSSMRAVEEALARRGDFPYDMFYFQVSKNMSWRNFVFYKRIGNHSFHTAP